MAVGVKIRKFFADHPKAMNRLAGAAALPMLAGVGAGVVHVRTVEEGKNLHNVASAAFKGSVLSETAIRCANAAPGSTVSLDILGFGPAGSSQTQGAYTVPCGQQPRVTAEDAYAELQKAYPGVISLMKTADDGRLGTGLDRGPLVPRDSGTCDSSLVALNPAVPLPATLTQYLEEWNDGKTLSLKSVGDDADRMIYFMQTGDGCT